METRAAYRKRKTTQLVSTVESGVNINSLANELLGLIFTEGTRTWRDTRPLNLPFPVIVSSVSSHWRFVAENTPALWAFVVPPLKKEVVDCVKWTKKWFLRSGALPISLAIYENNNCWCGDTMILVSQLLPLIQQNIHRLHGLDIKVNIRLIEDLAVNLKNASQLQHIGLSSITNYGNMTINKEDKVYQRLLTLSKLRKLRLANFLMPIPSSVTSLSVHGFHARYDRFYKLFLSNSPHITTLVIHDTIQHQELPVALISADSLTSLAVSAQDLDHAVYNDRLCKGYLIFPNLEYLEIDGVFRVTLVLGDASFFPKVHTLRISSRQLTKFGRNELKFYHSLPSIRTLQVIHVRDLSKLFAIDKKGRIPWPELQDITVISHSKDKKYNSARVLTFIKKHGGIRTLQISPSGFSMPADHIKKNQNIQRTKFASIRSSDRELGHLWIEWLGFSVVIKPVNDIPYGLLDDERAAAALDLV